MAYLGIRGSGCTFEGLLCLGEKRDLTHVLGKQLCLSFHLFPIGSFQNKKYIYYNNKYALATAIIFLLT